MNVTPHAPAVLPAPRADHSTSSSRGGNPRHDVAPFEHTLTQRQRAARSRERWETEKLPEPAPRKKSTKEAKNSEPTAENVHAQESAVNRATSTRDGGEASSVDPAADGANIDPADDESAASSETDELNGNNAARTDESAAQRAVTTGVVQVVQTAPPPVQVAAASVATTAGRAGGPAATAKPGVTLPASHTDAEGVLQGTASSDASSAASSVAPIVAAESTAGTGSYTQKPAAPMIDAGAPMAGGAASGGMETASLQAAPPPAIASAPGSEAVAAQFAQTRAGDDSALRDDVNLGRVVRGLTSAINQRGGSVTLRLTPPELGAVRIEMTVRDGVVNARFTAATESVRHLLMDQMGHLRSALDRQGLSVERIEVQMLPQQPATGGFDRQMDDAGREGRSAGEYTRQGGGRRDGEAAKRDGRGADSFEQAMAGAAE